MTGPEKPQSEPAPAADMAELQADIERTRAELGATTQALTDKLDVKARASEAAADAKDQLVEEAVPITAVVVAAAAVIVGVLVWRRSRR